MRIYLDTSVIGGVFAKIFSADTKPMKSQIERVELTDEALKKLLARQV